MRSRVVIAMIVAVFGLVSCREAVVPRGEPCVPGHDVCSQGTVCVADCRELQFLCLAGRGVSSPYPDPGCHVDGACRPDLCENWYTCPDDCRLACDVTTLTAKPPSDFLITAVRFPQGSSEAKATGCDLDGDFTVDNKAGGIIGAFLGPQPSIRDPSVSYQTAIAAGRLVVAVRVYPASGPGTGLGLVQVSEARLVDGGPPRLDGTDRLELLTDSGNPGRLCGRWEENRLIADPGETPLLVPVPTPDGSDILMRIHLAGARLDGEIDGTGIHGAFLGGGIPSAEFETLLYAEITADPLLLTLMDGCPDYGHTIAGCETLVPGTGDCAQDGVISPLEFRCHSIVHQLLSPDLPLDLTGGEPRVSLGVAIDAVPAIVVP